MEITIKPMTRKEQEALLNELSNFLYGQFMKSKQLEQLKELQQPGSF